MKVKKPIATLHKKELNIGYTPKKKKNEATNKDSGHRSKAAKR